jgi:2-polyprenyl-3-methyl-5-hydroxy-6-metoxy-1,4-benzoquinol methylase
VDQDLRIAQSWENNADAWVDAVRGGHIPSRRAGTDAAIVSAVLDSSPHKVLDAGCGEGWLARYLAQHGLKVTGFDGSEPLIYRAREGGGAEFLHVSYESFIAEPQTVGSDFDLAVFNFSLFAEDIVPALRAAASVLHETGTLIIQTVHPFNDISSEGYVDGWRMETFTTMSPDFGTPMPWYFRTMQTWIRSVLQAGLNLVDVREPVNSDTGRPLSLILVASR